MVSGSTPTDIKGTSWGLQSLNLFHTGGQCLEINQLRGFGWGFKSHFFFKRFPGTLIGCVGQERANKIFCDLVLLYLMWCIRNRRSPLPARDHPSASGPISLHWPTQICYLWEGCSAFLLLSEADSTVFLWKLGWGGHILVEDPEVELWRVQMVVPIFQKITPQSLQAMPQWVCELHGRAAGHYRYEGVDVLSVCSTSSCWQTQVPQCPTWDCS